MNLLEQDTHPLQKYRTTCEKCGGLLKRRSARRRFCSIRCFSNRRVPNNPDPTPDEISAGVRRIELTQGKFAIVDASDYEWVNQWVWYAFFIPEPGSFYAARNERTTPMDGKYQQRRILLHRALLDAPDDKWVDHEDRNPLNNSRKNLRFATPTQNASNRSKAANKSSKYKGASWCPSQSKWKSFITHEGRVIYLGLFEHEADAAEAYRLAALKYHGEFAHVPELESTVLNSQQEKETC